MTYVTIGLAILLAVPLLALAMVFSVGALCGVAAYHLSRQAVIQYQPTRKAYDPEKQKVAAVAMARKMAQETSDLQKEYLAGIQLTREQYLAAGGGNGEGRS